jgi:hypothetical protein
MSSTPLSVVRRCLPLFVTIALFSCANAPLPHEIAIQVPEGYTGALHVTPCAAPSVSMDQRGNVSVADCLLLGEKPQLVVTQGSRVYRIAPEKLTVIRTGDGIVVGIDTHVP